MTNSAPVLREVSDRKAGYVTMGRLIPAGTGFEYYKHVRIPHDEPPPPPAPSPEESSSSNASVDADEPFGRDEVAE